jgi:hypothetical protein
MQLRIIGHSTAQASGSSQREDVIADFFAAEVASETVDVFPHGFPESRKPWICRGRGVVLAVVVMGGIHIPPVLAPVLAFTVFHNSIGLDVGIVRDKNDFTRGFYLSRKISYSPPLG